MGNRGHMRRIEKEAIENDGAIFFFDLFASLFTYIQYINTPNLRCISLRLDHGYFVPDLT